MGMVEKHFSLNELKEKQELGYAWFISHENEYAFFTAKEKVKRQMYEFWNNIDIILNEEDEEFDIVEIFKNWVENDDLYNSLEGTINTLEALEELEG